MHDPMTLAFEIKNPFRVTRYPDGFTYRPSLIDIWHVDPETDHTDDSCDYSGTRPRLNPTEKALQHRILEAERVFGNAPYYPDSDAWRAFQAIEAAYYEWRRVPRGRRIPARWHVWHWRLRVWPYLNFLRWAFTRCRVCGGRFRWGESGVSTWGDKGPGWFRSETLEHMRHGHEPMEAAL